MDELTILKVDETTWSSEAQAGELAFHKRPNFRSNEEGFRKGNSSFFTGLGYTPTDMVGKTVVDLGAGSKLRAKFFEGSKIVAIEPLGDKFIEEVAWCDLKDAEKVFSFPAEYRISEIEGTVDFLFSINVLDHCYDFETIIGNIHAYLKTGGTCCLSFDCHAKVDKLHPIIINEKVATQIFFDIGFRIDKFLRTPSYHKAIAEYSVTFFMTKV
ncbi:methyltransferase domain-containing protein [Sinorhizobium fredii]|uniref:methyltransferase domain-containing protein n=1 Tax=Rhizobium fredii TaxID=380 RepID=UPI00056BEAAD|nr:methyltransferase domain-containing protein [Sinorhizobium fredii]